MEPDLSKKKAVRTNLVSLQTDSSSTSLPALPKHQSKASVTRICALLGRISSDTCFMDAGVVRDLHYVELPQLYRLAHRVEAGDAGVLVGVPPQEDLHVREVMVAKVHGLDCSVERGCGRGLCLRNRGREGGERSRRRGELREVRVWCHHGWLQGEIHYCCISLLHLNVLLGRWCVTVGGKKKSWLQQGASAASQPPLHALQLLPPSLNAVGCWTRGEIHQQTS